VVIFNAIILKNSPSLEMEKRLSDQPAKDCALDHRGCAVS
jgi:hypothetical protein